MKTPQVPAPKLAAAIGLSGELYLKREDQHKYGSHKGRSIPLMIKEYKKQGISDFVISSSGNAALAAIRAVKANNQNNPDDQIKLTVFVGKNIDEQKLKKLKAEIENFISIEQTEKPKQMAFQLDKSGQAKFLRQSTDELALQGYVELAEELNKIPDLQAIFIPTSSGTTAQALGQAFQDLESTLRSLGEVGQNPQIHIVQTQFCHPIAEEFDKITAQTKSSIAGAIVDKVAHRKQATIELINQSHGSGWIVSDEEIKTAVQLTKEKANIDISPNSALSIAGLKKAIINGWKFDGAAVCLITGK